MRKPFLFAAAMLVAAVVFLRGTSSAQNSFNDPTSLQNRRAPHMDSLRRVLKLSPDLHLDWLTSKNGVDTLRVVDNFNRSSIGPNWSYEPGMWQIVNGELDVTPDAIYEWRYLAVFQPVFNDANRSIYSVSYRWGRNADALGIREGAHALMIDEPNKDGSGYWLWHRTNWFEVWLWIIKDGTWEYTPGVGKQVDTAPSNLASNPVAGDVVTAYIRNEPDAVYFDYYVNQYFNATVKDVTKEFPTSNTWYVGAFIHGQELNNQIDDFTVTWLEGDVVGPAAVTDLTAVDSTTASIDLEWTAPGDNGSNGSASSLQLRYSTAPITAVNFSSATLAPNTPPPAPSGTKQTFSVAGLNSNTTYYFAIKTFDEVGNASPLSNVPLAKTKADPSVAQQLSIVNGCNQTGTVGANLSTPLTALVTDGAGTPVANSPVKFTVLSGSGTVGGQSSVTVNTDAAGEAKATWKLGTTKGTQDVEISAAGLQGSPQTCTATALAATPAKIAVVSGAGQVVTIGQAAPQPLVVSLIDKYNNPNANQSVVYTITSGGGYFLNGQTPAGNVIQTLTDASGLAQASVAVGNTYGDSTKITTTWTSSNGATTLATSFVVVASWPDVVNITKGNNQTAGRRTVLPDSLIVKVLDVTNVPAKNYPVTFSIKSGGGTLADNQTQVTINTDSSGYAATTWKLGNTVGTQKVEAQALFNNKNLRNSPSTFKATAFIPTGVEENTVAAPKQFALQQNYPNPFNPETTINFDLPEAGQVDFKVYDLAGRMVRQLLAGQRSAGSHRLIWDGKNDDGHSTESGVYFLVLRAKLERGSNELVANRKVVLMK